MACILDSIAAFISLLKESISSIEKCIGKIDSKTKEIVPTRKRKSPNKQGTLPSKSVARNFYGATYLFDRIGEKIGLIKDLKTCFPDSYRQILSLAYYLILEDRNPLSRFPRWAATHRHPYGKTITC